MPFLVKVVGIVYYLINRYPEGEEHPTVDNPKPVVSIAIHNKCLQGKLGYIRLFWVVFVQIVVTYDKMAEWIYLPMSRMDGWMDGSIINR